MPKHYFVYILTNRPRGVLYTGVTSNLPRRLYEHREKLGAGFTSWYNVTRLVHFEVTGDVYGALEREKQIKRWMRRRKIELIEKANPDWKDLSEEWDEH